MSSLSIVLPLHDARPLLDRVLAPLVRAVDAGRALELIVVDDASTDGGAEHCRSLGLTVVATERRSGPAVARNLGVERARGDRILFVDSDVVIHDDVPSIARETLDQEPDCTAVFGSYDDAPAAPGWVSKYVNLRHHFFHQIGSAESNTFWAGCGAVDRAAFLRVCGFDGSRYPRPSIEDVELGHRLRLDGGRILLRKDMQATHLKRWTLRSMIVTDVFRRALPWTRLLANPDYRFDDLNLRSAERPKALVAAALLCLLPLTIFAPHLAPWLAGALGAAFLANARLFLLIGRRAGPAHMLAAVGLHQLYYVYGAATYVYGTMEARRIARGAHETE